ncbi:MAG: hypothetical protein MJ239_03185 [Bacilli bacterium]|nr:hypothetical protein [Bacilli bacterium]
MKKNKLLVALAALSAVNIAAVAIVANEAQLSTANLATEAVYTMSLSGSNAISSAEIAAGKAVRKTALGSDIHFAVSSNALAESGYLVRLPAAAGNYIENIPNGTGNKISGIKKITINTNCSDGRWKLKYGLNYGELDHEVVYRKGSARSGWEDITIEFNTEIPANYFRIESMGSGTAIYIRSIKVEYSCEETNPTNANAIMETLSGDLLDGVELGGTDSSISYNVKDTTDLALPNSGYAIKMVAPAGFSGYKGAYAVLPKSYNLTNKNLVFFVKVKNTFPDMRIRLINGWDAVTDTIEVHLGDAWASVGSLDNEWRAVNITAAKIQSKMLGGKSLGSISNIEILFPFNENTSVERTAVVDRIIAGENFFGYCNAHGGTNSYKWTSIPLTADGSQIPAGKAVEFKIKASKDSSYTTALGAYNGNNEVASPTNILDSSGLRNVPDYSESGTVRMIMGEDGYWNVRIEANHFSTAPTKLVFTRWNESMGIIKDLAVVD